jgi:hypothetical protein
MPQLSSCIFLDPGPGRQAFVCGVEVDTLFTALEGIREFWNRSREKRNAHESHISDIRIEHSGMRPGDQTRRGGDFERLIQCFRDGSSFLRGKRHRLRYQNLCCDNGRAIRRLSCLQQLSTIQRKPECPKRARCHSGKSTDNGFRLRPTGLFAQFKSPRHCQSRPRREHRESNRVWRQIQLVARPSRRVSGGAMRFAWRIRRRADYRRDLLSHRAPARNVTRMITNTSINRPRANSSGTA